MGSYKTLRRSENEPNKNYRNKNIIIEIEDGFDKLNTAGKC